MRRSLTHDGLLENEYYEKDIRYTFQICKWVLKLIGIYPLIFDHASRRERLLSVAAVVLCCFTLHFVMIPFGYHTLFREEDLTAKIKFIGPLSFCVSMFVKYCCLAFKSSAFQRCIQQVEKDWRHPKDQCHRAIMIKHATRSRNLTCICTVCLYIGGLSYHGIMPLSSRKIVENVTARPIAYPGYEVFFDVQKSPMYEMVYFMHCVYALVVGNISMAACSLIAIFTTHVYGQIEIQRLRLENLRIGEEVVAKGMWENFFATVVKKHVEILR